MSGPSMETATAATLAGSPRPARHRPPASAVSRFVDSGLRWSCRFAAATILLMLVLPVTVLLIQAWPAIHRFGAEFLVSSEWRANELEIPVRDAAGKIVQEGGENLITTLPPSFGALPVLYGTAVSSLLALLFAVPFSFAAALFIVRVAPRLKIAGPLSFLIEFLAAIPSLAYGLWGLFVLAPFLATTVEPALVATLGKIPFLSWMFFQDVEIGGSIVRRQLPTAGRDMLCGGLVLGIMILPIITAVSRDVLKNVPRAQIEGSLAMGATWWQSCVEMLRYGRAGLFGAVMLGLARAAGETMAVTMVIGNNNQIVFSPLASAQTMASLLANEFAEATDGMHGSALLYVALILLVMSLMFNIVARYLVVGKNSRTSGAH
jgi:phosphate transport system permease protein